MIIYRLPIPTCPKLVVFRETRLDNVVGVVLSNPTSGTPSITGVVDDSFTKEFFDNWLKRYSLFLERLGKRKARGLQTTSERACIHGTREGDLLVRNGIGPEPP